MRLITRDYSTCRDDCIKDEDEEQAGITGPPTIFVIAQRFAVLQFKSSCMYTVHVWACVYYNKITSSPS